MNEELITAGQLAREVGVARETAAKWLEIMGGGILVGSYTVYPRDKAKRFVANKYARMLAFLECAPTNEESK